MTRPASREELALAGIRLVACHPLPPTHPDHYGTELSRRRSRLLDPIARQDSTGDSTTCDAATLAAHLTHHSMPFPHGYDRRYAPSGIRTRATTLKGWRPGPLVDGGGRSEDTRGRRYHPWPPRAVSSAGRAPALHAGGRRFESCTAHSQPSTHAGLAQPCGSGVTERARMYGRSSPESEPLDAVAAGPARTASEGRERNSALRHHDERRTE